MRRAISRLFTSGKDPPKPANLTQAELDILKQTSQFEKDLERKEWATNFASDSDADHYQVPDITKPQDSTPATVEFSSDEEVVPFFIDDLKEVQYVYKPRGGLEFDESGFACIYRKQRSWVTAEKFRYCKSLGWSYVLSAYFFLNHVYFGNAAPFIALFAPSLVLSRALLTDSIQINKAGTQLKFTTRRCRWLWSSQWTIDIHDFDEPKGMKFGLWKVYEFPDDLKTFAETESLTKYAYVKRVPKAYWSFLLFPAQPDHINREVLINALNGVYIDTSCGGSADLQSRYVVMDRKNIP